MRSKCDHNVDTNTSYERESEKPEYLLNGLTHDDSLFICLAREVLKTDRLVLPCRSNWVHVDVDAVE